MPDIIASDSSESSPLLVVGSVAFDNVITPQAEQERILGGAASYCSFAASYYTQVRMVGVVGNDFGESDLDRLRARGIDLEGVKKDDSGPTFFWKGKYHENFNRRDTLDIRLNVFEKFRPDLPESYKDSSFVLLGNIHPALQMHVLDQLAGNSFVLADTIDLWIETERESLLSLIKKVSVKSTEFSSYNFKLGDYISIKDHPKAKGVNLKLKAPSDWQIMEADRPNIVKKFVNDNSTYMITVKDYITFLSRKKRLLSGSNERYCFSTNSFI